MATRGIWIPIEIMNDSELSYSQKFILAEIEQLSQLQDGCYAQNSHFAELAGIAKATVSRSITGLKDMGYVEITVENGSRNHVRMITVNKSSTHDKTSSPPIQNIKPPMTKSQETKGNTHTNTHTNTQAFTFTLKKITAFDNLTNEYINELNRYIVKSEYALTFEHFRDTCLANGYKYKNFSLSYLNWAKKDFNSPAQKSHFKNRNDPQVGSIMWQLEQEAKEADYVDVQIESS